jgi:uncharacterized protein (TIGR03000 family)
MKRRLTHVSVVGLLACLVAGALLAQTGAPTVQPNQAVIVVRVPADANVTVGGQATTQKGPQRSFTVLNLEPGYTYSYEVVVRWIDNGKERSEKHTVQFQAGQTKTLDVTPPATGAKDKVETKDQLPPPKEKVDSKDKLPPKDGFKDFFKDFKDFKGTKDKVETDKAPTKEKGDLKDKDKALVKDKAPVETEDKKVETKDKAPKDAKDLDKKTTPPPPDKDGSKSGAVRTRSFLFTYAGAVKELAPGTPARVWIPMATTNGQQDVAIASQTIPGTVQIAQDRTYRNTILSFEGKANDQGVIPFEVTYRVDRKEVRTDAVGHLFVKPAPGDKIDRYLRPDAKVPVTGKPLELLSAQLRDKDLPDDPFAAARVLYDVVNRYMTYKKEGTGWGQGDVLWACDSKYGNCSDFHSLFISMARGNGIASKFEMGFPLPPKHGSGAVGGYHCWAWFLAGDKGWVPVDISEANQHPERTDYCFGNLCENRVSFSVGRDIDLEPRQSGPPLNFFIYPYVEVNGKSYPAEKVQRSFSFKDVS